jgi:hypothetical protein
MVSSLKPSPLTQRTIIIIVCIVQGVSLLWNCLLRSGQHRCCNVTDDAARGNAQSSLSLYICLVRSYSNVLLMSRQF